MISDRPAHVLERLEAGHWEGDLIAGPGHRSNIATLVERATRFTVLVPVPGSRHAEVVHRGLVAALGTLPPDLRRSITWDQGTDLSVHTPERLQAVAHQLNRRPRAVLGGRTPAELSSALLPFPDHPLLRP